MGTWQNSYAGQSAFSQTHASPYSFGCAKKERETTQSSTFLLVYNLTHICQQDHLYKGRNRTPLQFHHSSLLGLGTIIFPLLNFSLALATPLLPKSTEFSFAIFSLSLHSHFVFSLRSAREKNCHYLRSSQGGAQGTPDPRSTQL